MFAAVEFIGFSPLVSEARRRAKVGPYEIENLLRLRLTVKTLEIYRF